MYEDRGPERTKRSRSCLLYTETSDLRAVADLYAKRERNHLMR